MVSINVLTIGDPHFKESNVRDWAILEKQIDELIVHEKVDLIVVLGDTLDRHNIIHLQPFSRAIKWLKSLASKALTYVLIGNHDRLNNSVFLDEQSPFMGIDVQNLVIVDLPKCLEFKGYNFVFVPYVPNGRFQEALESVEEVNSKYQESTAIFAHQEFKGTKYKGKTSSKGDKWPEDCPLIISGHIHEKNQPQDNIIYPGTPIQVSYDEPADKSLSIFTFSNVDGDKEEIDESESRLMGLRPQEITYERTEYPVHLPKKVDLKWSLNDDLDDKLLELLESEDHIKLTLIGDKAQITNFRRSVIYKQLDEKGVVVTFRRKEKVQIIKTSSTYIDRLVECLDDELLELWNELSLA